MNDPHQIKNTLYEVCAKQIAERIATIEQRLEAIAEARDNETKSSVGDKYETGRAMMQLEAEKAGVQLAETRRVKIELEQIDPGKTTETVGPGSLVLTDRGIYFLAVGIGKIKLDGQTYYCISENAPIGRLLLSQKQGAVIGFNDRQIKILEIY